MFFMGWLLSMGLCTFATSESKHLTKFIIEELPRNTPHDATIYLTADFDGWYPDITNRQFVKNDSGQLELTVKHDSDTIQFKITRGSWASVEARENGRAIPNHTFITTGPYSEVHVRVESWEDISYRWYIVYMFFLVLGAVQGALLIVAINTIRNKNKQANTYLSVLLGLITISLLGRASTFDPDIFTWQPKLIFVPEIILFTYGPIFYLYIHKLLVIDLSWKRMIPFFIPVLIQIGLYIPYLNEVNQELIYSIIDKELFPYFAITGVVALFLNAYYWFLFQRTIRNYRQEEVLSDKQKNYVRFLRWVLNLKAFYLFLWLLVVIIYGAGEILGVDLLFVSENLIDILWLLFSLIVFALAFYAVKNPEVLREKKKYQDNKLKTDEVKGVQDKLNDLLEKDKIYTKQDLTLESLAHMIPTATHTLSRIINEHYQQSFSDLINTYRVKEFTKRVEEKPDSSYLEVALGVGFNSKPTFNRAFKKVQGCTPRQYFKK